MSAAIASPQGRPRDPRLDEAILESALELIAEVGYEAMTIEAIAARAGVGKPTIYRRWPGGKRELVIAAVHAKQRAWEPPADTGSLRGDLLALTQRLADHFTARAHLTIGMIAQIRASEELRQLFREHILPARHEWMMIQVARAIARGELPAEPPVTPLYLNVAPSLIFSRIQFDLGPLDHAFVAELVDHILLPILQGSHGRTG
jgi:AcrR family transcriptional regulator